MTISEQIKGVKKQLDYFMKVSENWVRDSKMSEMERNYQKDCLECAINSLAVLDKFERDLAAKDNNLIKEITK
jgi:hypothetical protein